MNEIEKMQSLTNNDSFKKEKEKSIASLMKNKEVCHVLETYHLKQEDVEEHWVDFLNYVEDKQQCIGCTSIKQCPKVSKGMQRSFDFHNHRVSLSLTPCLYGKEIFENQEILNRILLKNVGDHLLLTKSSDLTNIMKQKEGTGKSVIEKLGNYIKNPTKKGFFLYGNPGTGKSTLMGWLTRALVKDGYSCGYIHFPTFLMDLKNSFGEDGIYESIELMKNIDYLVIDDIGGESVTTWSRDEVLSSVLAYRAQNSKATFFTSVASYKDLKKYYTLKNGDTMRVERLIDRMKAVSNELELKGEDLR